MEAKLNVSLLRCTPDAEKLVASAAKLCYSQVGVEEIEGKTSEDETSRFLNVLMDLGHQSPVEHVSFTFGIEGVSRVLTHQLVRHRLASYSQQSQRYVKLNQFEYIIPESIKEIPEAKKKFEEAMEEDQKRYEELTEILFKEHYQTYLDEGKSEKQAKRLAEKRSIEDARYVFPNACETKIVVTMNARTLFNFFEHRCCNRAQWEIKNLANEMLKLVKKECPVLFKNAGPRCVHGVCPEGKMTCGKIDEVRKYYKSI